LHLWARGESAGLVAGQQRDEASWLLGGQAPRECSEGIDAKSSRGIGIECHPEEMAF
jgi:hypothetical protein